MLARFLGVRPQNVGGRPFDPLDFSLDLYLPQRSLESDGAADISSTNYLFSADSDDFSPVDNDFWFNLWVNFDTKAGAGFNNFILSKNNTGQEEYWIHYRNNTAIGAADRIYWSIKESGGSEKHLEYSPLAGPSTGIWYNLTVGYDATLNKLMMKINALSTIEETSVSPGPANGTARFELGSIMVTSQDFDGAMDSVVGGKAPPTGLDAVFEDIHTFFYNSGDGRKILELTSTQKTDWGIGPGFAGGWELDEAPNEVRDDTINTNHLSVQGSVGARAGVVEGDVSEGALISRWSDLALPAEDATQSTILVRPVYDATEKAAFFVAASGQYLTLGDVHDTSSADFSIGCWFKLVSGTSGVNVGLMSKYLSAGWILRRHSSDKIRWTLDDGPTIESITSNVTITDTNWHHVVCVRDGNTARLYVDGIEDKTGDITGLGSLDNTEDFYIGRYSTQYMDGYLDEGFYKSAALTASQVGQIFNYGHGK